MPMPAPVLRYSPRPITTANPGTPVYLPEPEPLDVTQSHLRLGQGQGDGRACAVSFTDGLNGQTTYHYHVELCGLEPDTRYYYQVSDGATPLPATAGASFQTAPAGRARFRFSSYGDLGTPSGVRNVSGNQWFQSCDNAWYAVEAIENPGDGQGAPLFHLLNGDVSYANLDYPNAPGVWRDFGVNVARSAANRPWMPALGNHETEFGTCDHAGRPGQAEGGIGAQAAAGNYWNGPYGYGHYLSRFRLPDNGIVNHDGNRLRGNFYAFRVGTVLFVSLDADDVIYQDSAAGYVKSGPNAAPMATPSGAQIPNGTVTYNRGYTGDLKIDSSDFSARPDFAAGTPNLQTLWLERTLRAARQDPETDMIVIFMHQCALSSAMANGSDLGIRQAWLPLFDEYEVDLVLSGHEHNYERSYPVRGYDAGYRGTIASPNPGQARGESVDTRRPRVVATEPVTCDGAPAWDTRQGTVYLVLGCAGSNAPSNRYGADSSTGRPRAKVMTQRNVISGSQATGLIRGGADAREDAPWSAATNDRDGYGYAIFDVDPGHGPGETTITFQFFAIPAVSGEPGTTTLPTEPYEKLVFGRGISGGDERDDHVTEPLTTTPV
jgi:Purple acid Phosphatase, N-terminal domain/Calcineurin-like phosphoesterase